MKEASSARDHAVHVAELGSRHDAIRGQHARVETLSEIIQGGMGIGVSGWRLARAVSHMDSSALCRARVSRRSLCGGFRMVIRAGHSSGARGIPLSHVAAETLRRYLLSGGRPAGTPYGMLPMYSAGDRGA